MARKKIAIIGTGISGMAAAYCLNHTNDIKVFEKNPVPGGHTRTKKIQYGNEHISVDTGFIVFNKQNYPELTGLFKHLSVDIIKSNMSFGMTLNDGLLEWGSQNIDGLFGQRKNLWNLSFYQMLWDAQRFFKYVQTTEINSSISLGDFLKHSKIGDSFKNHFLLPMGAAIWSCPLDSMLDFPAHTFIKFFQNHGLLSFTNHPQWYTVKGGSENYLLKLIAHFQDKIHLNDSVVKVTPTNGQVWVETQSGLKESFDDVVLGCHGDEALKLLSDPTPLEKKILGSFHYHPNRAYLHKDPSLMPKNKKCWSSWVYGSSKNQDPHSISVTYWMNNLQNIDKNKPMFVTLNPHKSIDADKIFDIHDFDHPVFNRAAIEAQDLIPQIQGTRNIWYCGAYQRYGFHEDGLSSALKVVENLGGLIPWHKP